MGQSSGGSGQSWFLYDGHGSTRALADSAGAVTDRYDYDAYGCSLSSQVSSLNPPATALLYSGEQFDLDLQQQYLRARYYAPTIGCFNRLDPYAGNHSDPQSLHKYAYCQGDPVNGVDPTGLSNATEQVSVAGIVTTLVSLFGPVVNTGFTARRMSVLLESDPVPGAFIISFAVSEVLHAGYGTGIGGAAGIDFLYIYSERRWYGYLWAGFRFGVAGPGYGLEFGYVWGVDQPEDYSGPYWTSTTGAEDLHYLVCPPRILPAMQSAIPGSGSLFHSSPSSTAPLGTAGFTVGGGNSKGIPGLQISWYSERSWLPPLSWMIEALSRVGPPPRPTVEQLGAFGAHAVGQPFTDRALAEVTEG